MPAIAHQNKILGNTSGGGSTIKVTTSESSLYGQTVTLTDGTTTLTGTFSNAGECEFTGVMMIGTLTATSSTASKSIQVPYFGVYTMTLSFFTATITVTFDASKGATCTLDGVTVSTSPYAFTVSSAGTYTASCTLDGVTKQGTAKVITTDGQTETDTIEFGTINVTYDNDFRGTSITCTQGGTTITKTAPSTGNTMSFYPDTTGTWEITGSYSGTTYSSGSITVSSLSTAVSATLQTLATITVTIYGATEDTITFTDAASVSHTVVFATGQSSKSETLKVLPSGSSITFTSGVAKNPDNLSNDYTKTVTLTSASTEVYVMPDDGVLYWWGYENNLEQTTSANGWSQQTDGTTTFNVNSITIGAPYGGVGSKNAINTKTIHSIMESTVAGTWYGIGISLKLSNTKALAIGTTTNQSVVNTVEHLTYNDGNTYIYGAVNSTDSNRAGILYALWYE